MTTTSMAWETTEYPWWLVLLEGIFALILGVLLLAAPGATVTVAVQIMGFFWLVKGIFQIVSIFISRSQWGWKLFAGILGIVAGILVLQHPLYSAILVPTLVVWIIAIEGLIIGAVGLVAAFQGGGWGAAILGVLSIIFGLLLLGNPLLGAQVMVLLLGIFAVIGGISAMVVSLQLRRA
jgi:uncharacterized membrane protein HdeD (DUF308 family)